MFLPTFFALYGEYSTTTAGALFADPFGWTPSLGALIVLLGVVGRPLASN